MSGSISYFIAEGAQDTANEANRIAEDAKNEATKANDHIEIIESRL
ncbi:hypothetical protein [Methanohalophilus sp.]|nr:hypothetical protein [Methanohalophilus sp.]